MDSGLEGQLLPTYKGPRAILANDAHIRGTVGHGMGLEHDGGLAQF